MKQIIQINENNRVKNPNWGKADQLAIYKDDRGVEPGTYPEQHQQSNRKEIALKQHIIFKTVQELNANRTSQTTSLNKSFLDLIFYSESKHHKTTLLLPTWIRRLGKKCKKSSISSLFISNVNQAGKQQEFGPVAPGGSLSPSSLLFSYKSLTRLRTWTNSCLNIFNEIKWRMILAVVNAVVSS